VFKGKKMAGHMGDRQRTQQNLEIVRTDAIRGLIFVKGSVPGSENGWLLVRDAVKIAAPEGLPFPGAILEKKSTQPEHDEAPAGMVEAAAEHEVVEQVTPEQQEELLQTQEAGAETDAEIEAAAEENTDEGGEAGSTESKES